MTDISPVILSGERKNLFVERLPRAYRPRNDKVGCGIRRAADSLPYTVSALTRHGDIAKQFLDSLIFKGAYGIILLFVSF